MDLIVYALIIGLILLAIQALIPIIGFVLLYVVAPVIGAWFVFALLRTVFHWLSPAAKMKYMAKVAEAERERAAKKAAKHKAEEEAAAKELQEHQAAAAAKARHEAQLQLEARQRELAREEHRDADHQAEPYTYLIGKHGNESLAIRYGIANNTLRTKEYWYTASGGEQRRNPRRDHQVLEPADSVRLQKIARVGDAMYRVQLRDFSDREALAIIEPRTEYVKTFYPIDGARFEKHADLERTLKGNGSFSLKELATFHVQKAVGGPTALG